MGVDVGKEVENDRDQWGTEVVPHVLQLVSAHLGQRDVCALLCVSTSICYQLTSHAPLWKVQSRFSSAKGFFEEASIAKFENWEDVIV